MCLCGACVKALLFQLDGKIPNVALMRIAAHHRERGDDVELRWGWVGGGRGLLDDADQVYASAIFEKTRPKVLELLHDFPGAIVGGTGWKTESSLEAIGITTNEQDYSIYPKYTASIGFTQRGCRLKCPFCVVPKKEGKVQAVQTINQIWRGEPWPRELILLDNDFFGGPEWPERIREIKDGGFKVSFCQGINARFLNDETAAAIASVNYRSNSMKERRIYTAWDNRKDEARLFRGLELLVKHGVRPGNIMVYILIGYWPGETEEDREYRRRKLRDFGCDPYPMPFERTPELVGFQRWVVGHYDKRVPWADWVRAEYRPNKLGLSTLA